MSVIGGLCVINAIWGVAAKIEKNLESINFTFKTSQSFAPAHSAFPIAPPLHSKPFKDKRSSK